jgi:hypothetical protein
MESEKGLVLPGVNEHVVQTVAYLVARIADDSLPEPVAPDQPVYMALEDIKLIQKVLDFRLKEINAAKKPSDFVGLDHVDWGEEHDCPRILNNYFSIRCMGGMVVTIAVDYDLSAGDCRTVLDGKTYLWNGADIAAAIRLIDVVCGFPPVLIWPNSVVPEYNQRIVAAVEAVSGIDELAAGTVSSEWRNNMTDKCAFLLGTIT